MDANPFYSIFQIRAKTLSNNIYLDVLNLLHGIFKFM